MQDFSIVSSLQLTTKPAWLDGFRKKYDVPRPYHLTIKNSTYIQNGTKEDIKRELQEIVKTISPIPVSFNRIFHQIAKKGECIMIDAVQDRNTQQLHDLQKRITNTFAKYGTHIKPTYREYETHFTPHLTIARHINPQDFPRIWEEVLSYGLQTNCECTINSLTLVFAEVEDETEIEGTHEYIDYPFPKS